MTNEKLSSNQEQNNAEAIRKPVDDLIIERGKTVNFEDLPDESIALDGYVQGPARDLERGKFSFDHHDKVDRQITRATCQQIMDALLLGFDPSGRTIYINDVDGDTVLSVWLLRNPEKANDPKVRMLVESAGGIDSYGPAYAPLDKELADIFFKGVMKPEVTVRRNRQYGQTDLQNLLDECIGNLDSYLSGNLEYKPEEDNKSFEIIKRGTGWIMAESNDFVFDLIYKEGYTRAIACHKLPDGSYAYTVAKKSELVEDFPVGPVSKEGTILYVLNQKEFGWGGGSTVGGAPNNKDGSRSRLTPDEVFDIVEGVIKK